MIYSGEIDINTGRTSFNNIKYGVVSSVFIVDPTIEFADITDINEWLRYFNELRIQPIHNIFLTEPLIEETEYHRSKLNYIYKLVDGKLIYKFNYTGSIDKYTEIKRLNNLDKSVIMIDIHGNVYHNNNKGIKLDLVYSEKNVLPEPGTNLKFKLYLAFNELIESITKVEFNPSDIDRQAMVLDVTASPDVLNFFAYTGSAPIETIEASEVTLVDNSNVINFGFLTYLGGGNYRMDTFTHNGSPYALTTGYLQILTNLYIGCSEYRARDWDALTQNLVTEDGDNLVTEDGDNLILD